MYLGDSNSNIPSRFEFGPQNQLTGGGTTIATPNLVCATYGCPILREGVGWANPDAKPSSCFVVPFERPLLLNRCWRTSRNASPCNQEQEKKNKVNPRPGPPKRWYSAM
jgi:hypothetical protein